jgi:hypothetical protein
MVGIQGLASKGRQRSRDGDGMLHWSALLRAAAGIARGATGIK